MQQRTASELPAVRQGTCSVFLTRAASLQITDVDTYYFRSVMQRVLVIFYSQTGQLSDVLESMLAPLRASPHCEVVTARLQPRTPYPFPWPFWRFFDVFPETVAELPAPNEPLDLDTSQPFDLVILAYQVWFLSPSMPTCAFLQSDDARRLLAGRRVMTVIACRNMWLQAQERVKLHLARLGAHLVDNIVFTDTAPTAATFISTPLWMLTGRRGPFLGGRIPAAGVSQRDIKDAQRFGHAIAQQLPQRSDDDRSPFCSGLGAVRINEHLIPSEAIGRRSFRLWGKLLRLCGRPGGALRRLVLAFYIALLIVLILTVVPVSAAVRRLLAPLTAQRRLAQRKYFAAPSGEADHLRAHPAKPS